jgi:hypothetical protein
VTTTDRTDAADIRITMAVSAAMIAFQVGGRATRDALFLSNHRVTDLPPMVAVAAAMSLVAAVLAAKAMGRWGPGRFLPALFAMSATLLLLEAGLLRVRPGLASILYYIHFNAMGALLVSSFYSLVNERFDPRSAKRAISRIGAGGGVGGVAGGLLAALLSVAHMLPMLAIVHVACAALMLAVGTSRSHYGTGPADLLAAGPVRTLIRSPYLQTLAAVVLLATLSEGLLDQVFKTAAARRYGSGPDLLQMFALFYTCTNVLGVALTAGLGRRALERLGLARTVGILPWTVAVGGAAAIAWPRFASAMIAKGCEAIVRNSLYRSGYELLFTPVPPGEKRAVKALLDIGAVRIGDMAAAGLVQLALLVWAAQALPLMLVMAIACAAAGIMLTLTIHSGYVATLERNLLNRAVQLDMDEVADATTRFTLAHTAAFPVPAALGGLMENAAPGTPIPPPPDPVLARLAALRSRNPARVQAALRADVLEPEHVAQAITLLAWDAVSPVAAEALAGTARRHTGQLVDALLDPEADFAVRRRIAAPLAQARNQRAMDGLLAGLHDQRFEVRFRCGRALNRLRIDAPELTIDPERVYAAVLREAAVDRQVWESQRLLERDDDPPPLDVALKDRASRSLEHVFTVLALVLPRQPLQIAFRGLHTDDPQLRGTALEYLETALPPKVRATLWPFLGDSPARARRQRPSEQVVAELIGSGELIALNLEDQRRRQEAK